ncbi:rhodanese-like domain-containing protein [Arthrobacter subterraneus]|uniref:rhodanese-like domain-containing protein n=1 Tax=Arthrobacter subterraneus TaxID=335973 RepID=UPI003814A6CF
MASASSTVTTLEPPVLREWISEHEDLVIVDVRSAAEYENLHIRGSYNVPLPLLAQHAAQVQSRLGSRVVLVCQSGVRAEQARQRLASAGVDSALVLAGGVPAFAHAGGEVIEGAQRWALERQVRMVAGSLVLTGLLAGRFISPKLQLIAGGIGAGLTFSAATNTCAMGTVLSKMPWNRSAAEPTLESAISQLPSLN